MRKEHIGGIVALGVIALVIYYLWKQPSGAAGVALRQLWQKAQTAIGSNGGGSRVVDTLPDASTMGTTPTNTYKVPVMYGGDLTANGLAQPDQSTLIAVLNAPVGTIMGPGGNNGDVIENLRLKRMLNFQVN